MRLPSIKLPPFKWRWLFLWPSVTILLVVLCCCAASQPLGQQFTDLAQGFLHGHLYMYHTHYGMHYDPVPYKGHQYWDEGPFPSVLLLPFVAIFNALHLRFYQGYVAWLLVVGVCYWVYRLARYLRYSAEDSLILMLGFVLGSAFLGVAAVSSGWLYAQLLTVFLLFWSLYEFLTHRRWWLIGVLCGAIFLTRATAAPIIIFFGLELLTAKKVALKPYVALLAPLAAAVGLQALYNFARFHSPFNGGYRYQLLAADSAAARDLGVFSLKHVPTNLYYMFLGTPVAVPQSATAWTLASLRNNVNGMSIFITSPYFMWLFGRNWPKIDKTVWRLLATSAVSCLAVLCFYGLGRTQLGYRYTLDFLPGLYLVFMMVYQSERGRLSRSMKFVLIAAGFCNAYFLLSYITI